MGRRLEGNLMERQGKVEAAVKEINKKMYKNMETVKEMNEKVEASHE